MPHATDEDLPGQVPSNARRLVLCFDGTGNKFQGDESDTNIVKIYQMLQRDVEGQYHYYQPGIGTSIENRSNNLGVPRVWPKVKSKIATTVDQAVGTSFVDHVLAGYRFVMRYYAPGDDIYIFGFSRGAYTARFLSEMLHNIGLLSKGNEEMVDFAWETFSNFQRSRGNVPQTAEDEKLREYMVDFKETFCRPDVGVHFLGLFDCVNSVGQFEIPLFRSSYEYIATPAAKHIRHAVSIHERRLKFKPALFHFGENAPAHDLKEMWFAGNHGDVGGGWHFQGGQTHLLSDTPLNWMVQESLNLPSSKSQLVYQTTNISKVKQRENLFPDDQKEAGEVRRKANQPHDMLRFGGGASIFMTILWWIIEILPIFTRLELEKGAWVPRYLPPNLGAPRDIPNDALIHDSVYEMLRAGILDDSQIPKTGGDNSHLPSPASVVGAWKRLRLRKATEDGRAGLNQAAATNEGVSSTPKRSSENGEDLVPKKWS